MKRLLLLLIAACASTPDASSSPKLGVAEIDLPTYTASVQPVVERRCGSVDCHGTLPRGLRVYGKNSLRLANDAGAIVGTGDTTPEEARTTYQSILGLEPEKTDRFAAKSPRTAEDAYDLLFLAKPLAIERHRPGASLKRGEPAERCMTSWLLGTVDATACTDALAN